MKYCEKYQNVTNAVGKIVPVDWLNAVHNLQFVLKKKKKKDAMSVKHGKFLHSIIWLTEGYNLRSSSWIMDLQTQDNFLVSESK